VVGRSDNSPGRGGAQRQGAGAAGDGCNLHGHRRYVIHCRHDELKPEHARTIGLFCHLRRGMVRAHAGELVGGSDRPNGNGKHPRPLSHSLGLLPFLYAVGDAVPAPHVTRSGPANFFNTAPPPPFLPSFLDLQPSVMASWSAQLVSVIF
jgi:hypothetical protein